ncbi:MAG: hypothetical protein JO331_15365 [Verrucomicrobia bacterium]|nr:hypothetical protein [Verrucomicrobiota bacterium]
MQSGRQLQFSGVLGFHLFEDLDDPPHTFRLMPNLCHAHLAASQLARLHQLAQAKLPLGTFNQH